MKVGLRLAVGFFLVIMCIWATVFFAENTYKKIHEEFEQLNEDVIPGAIVTAEMQTTAVMIAYEFMKYILHGKEEAEKKLHSAMESLTKIGLTHLEHETHIGQEEQNAAEELVILINRLTSLKAKVS